MDQDAIRNIINQGAIVLLSPLGFSPTGEAFNLAMEDLATSAAIHLRAEKLIFMTQDRTVRDADGAVDNEFAHQAADKLRAEGTLEEYTASPLGHDSLTVKRGVGLAHILTSPLHDST